MNIVVDTLQEVEVNRPIRRPKSVKPETWRGYDGSSLLFSVNNASNKGGEGAMDRLLRAFRGLDLHTPPPIDDEDTAVLVAERISLKTWNRFAQLDHLPRGLRLRQLVWDDGRVYVVEFPFTNEHEDAIGYIQRVFARALQFHGSNRGQANISGPDGPNGSSVTLAPDFSYIPNPRLPGNRLPRDAVTVVVEIMHSQNWWSVQCKLRMYRQLPHLQYVFLVRMSDALSNWTYELHARNPDFLDAVIRHQFRTETVPDNHNHFVHLDSRRVLGLQHDAQLPAECPGEVVVNVVELARHVLAYAG
ncbi:hypothetical protein PHYSODRAFT_306347 [Phytophthora sojae]|uniref:Restriction endonuclease domain-containing protein n=1 Tax=Phytophthora sojae (strain P6497) TaxID=1094619 RepID=G5A969_PHYSP|nr:hypothetical protein PHYSODRAFT_306347 [Phytophthora sojae]EGZ08445.1 hypothetical protein PHYSODRAFT_306347 [Phytophthora sojae]|eukprot:XP_009536617.1 hypothetical protein PHYSODRAFT_306347 [Phytophthora sojae]